MKKVLVIVVCVIISVLLAYPIGHWARAKYSSDSWLYIGPFQGYFTGLLLSYVFVSPLLCSLIFRKVRYGFYISLPVLIFGLLDLSSPWVTGLFFSFGFGFILSSIILIAQKHIGKE